MTYQLPVWIILLQALAVPVLAAFGAFIAYQQYRLGTEKLRLELFEKWLEVFSLAEQFSEKVIRDGYPAFEDFRTIWKARDSSRFLFGREIEQSLEELHKHAGKLRVLNSKIERGDYSQRSVDIDKQLELTQEFEDKYRKLPAGFEKYLKFATAKGF
jgi:hypothetical protein